MILKLPFLVSSVMIELHLYCEENISTLGNASATVWRSHIHSTRCCAFGHSAPIIDLDDDDSVGNEYVL
jgi:hypothetical protein